MKIEIIDPSKDCRWSEFVKEHPNGVVFHTPAWIKLLSETYGYRPLAYTFMDSTGIIHRGIPFLEISSPLIGKRWVSLPFTDYCPPLYTKSEELQAILEYLINIRKAQKLKNIEIRFPIHNKGIFWDNSFVLHILRLDKNPEVVFKGFRKKGVQYEIKKAQRDGVEVRTCASKKEFEIFYDLQLMTRKRLGVPIQPKRFFELLWDRLIEKDFGFVLIAYKNAVPLSGAVFLKYKSTVSYKYSASDPNYLRLSPNNAVLWRAIEWACINGYEVFDFGKTRVANVGLRNFKRGWGTVEQSLPYSFIASSPASSGSGLFHRLAGTVIRHSPSFVCRGIGEALYKHFG